MFLVLKRILFRLITRQYCEVYYINGPDNLPAPLSREQEAAVFLRLEEGDPKAKEMLITHNLRIDRYRHRGPDFHRHHRAYQGRQYLLSRKEYQAGDLRLPLHRKRDFDAPAQNTKPKDRDLHR